MHRFELNSDAFPLMISVIGDNLSDDDYHALFAAWDEIVARKQPFVSLVDLRMARTMPHPTQRAMIGAWMRKVDATMSKYSVGSANVIISPLVRGALTAIQWIHRPVVAQATFGTMLEACDWCIERLQRNRVPLTPAIETYRARLLRHSA